MYEIDDRIPAVLLGACPTFRPDPDCPWCTCTVCGWLENDHDAPLAPVIELRVETVLRRAS